MEWVLAALLMFLQSGQRNPCEPKPGYDWGGADVELVYVTPGEYPGLPKSIATWLEARGFTIPQSYCASGVHNAFKAELAAPGSADWAVLASRADSSRIIVFWSAALDSISEIHQYQDSYYICNGRRYGYSRVIVPSNAADELERYSYYEVTPPVTIDHTCLEDIYCEKASAVFYWHEGKQFELIGAD